VAAPRGDKLYSAVPGPVGELDKDEPRIDDSSNQHRDQRRDQEIDPVLVPEDQDDRRYDQQ